MWWRGMWSMPRPGKGVSSRVAVAWILAAFLLVGFIGVALAYDVPEEPAPTNNGFPGTGVVFMAAIGIVALACLADAIRAGRRERRSKPPRDDDLPG